MLYSKIEGEGTQAEGESSEAKPLLILHGFLGMSDNWKTIWERNLLPMVFKCILLDLRNHGTQFSFR